MLFFSLPPGAWQQVLKLTHASFFSILYLTLGFAVTVRFDISP
jgi:hypothetical protein